MTEDIERLKEAEKTQAAYEYENEAEFKWELNECEGNQNWLAGVVLTAIGFLTLFSNLTGYTIHNWWAFFILIPAISSLGKAWSKYRRHGRFSRSVRRHLTGAFTISLVAGVFLFDLEWGFIWPFLLIIWGFSILFNGWFD